MEPLQPFEGDLHELFERPRKQALSIILKISIATLILWGPVPNKEFDLSRLAFNDTYDKGWRATSLSY